MRRWSGWSRVDDEAGRARGGAPETAVDLELPTGRRRRPRRERAARGLDDLRSLLLGFDIDPRDEGRTLADYLAARAELPRPGCAGRAPRSTCCSVFADFAELSRNRPAGEETDTEDRVHSPREHFHTYLQSLDVDRGGLPDEFRSPAGAGARPLRRHRPRAHARAGGGGVPDLPRPAAHRLRRRAW